MAVSTASPSKVAAIQQAVQSAQERVTVLIQNANNAIGTPTTFGGVMAGMPAPASANALLAALSNTQQLITLLQLQGVLGRLMKNLGAVNSSPNVVTTAGGNLYRIAQDHYGDPTLWTGIAAANDLTDPFVQGTESLTIPPTPAPSGGVLSS